MGSKLDYYAQKIKSKSGLAKYRTRYLLELRRAKRLGNVSEPEYSAYRDYYNQRASQENVQGLQRLAEAPERVVGGAKQAAVRTLEQQQTILSPPKQAQVTVIQDQYGRVYKGKQVGGQFIGVRPVSKREQQLKARAGFYSFTSSKPKEKKPVQVVAEQTAIRGGLGLYSPYPLTSDVKFEFTKPEPAPKEKGYKAFVSKGESVYQEFMFRGRKRGGLQYYAAAVPVKFTKGVIGGVGDLVTHPVDFAKSTIKLAFFPLYPKFAIETVKETGKQIITNPIETAGRFTGQGLVFKGIGLAGKGLNKIGTRVYSEYQFKFQSADKGIYSKFDYETAGRYYTGAGQRNLFGRNIGETPSPAGNVNKVGFGIEKNTLRGASNDILPTGQTKLASNDIIALNKVSGRFSKVKITPQKDVFVYNSNLRKFTELTSEYKLITRNPKYQYDLVKAENIYKPSVQTFDTSTQVKLVDLGFKNPVRTSPIYKPVAKSSFKPSTKPLKVFSKEKTVSTFKPKVIQTSELFSGSQYTYPSYSVETMVQKPVTQPISNVKLVSGREMAGAGLSSGLRLNQRNAQAQFSIQGTQFKTGDVQVQKPTLSFESLSKSLPAFKYKESVDTVQLPKVKQSYKLAQAQAQVQVQVQRQDLMFGKVQTPMLNNRFNMSQKQVFETPKRYFNFFSPKKSRRQREFSFKSFKVKQPKSYFPSLRASLFSIKGSRGLKFTGLEERLL